MGGGGGGGEAAQVLKGTSLFRAQYSNLTEAIRVGGGGGERERERPVIKCSRGTAFVLEGLCLCCMWHSKGTGSLWSVETILVWRERR